MDEIIKGYPYREFGDDLNYCYEHGLMYQRDMTKPVDYDEAYFENYVRRENTEIARRLNRARCSITEKYCDCIVDVGVGSGEFIKSLHARGLVKAYGYDINPAGVHWLTERGLYSDIYEDVPQDVEGFTLWDTLEHIPNPQVFFRVVRRGDFLFVSLPVFQDLEQVRQSKHYKKNEHFYYFSSGGLVRLLDDSGFDFVESNDAETIAGREGIGTFVFLKR